MEIQNNLQLTGIYRFTIRDAKTGEIKRVQEYKNLITTAGRAALASHLTSASPSPTTIRINYVALGTNAAAPANGDTQLGTETYRNAVASETNASNVAYVSGFFGATEVSGTLNEVGLFIAGTATANSGTLFSHAAISVTKSTTETLTIDYTITIS